MAGMMLGSAIVNALSFTGGSYLFKKLDKDCSEAEMKRHNFESNCKKLMLNGKNTENKTIDFVNLQLKK
jgi:hypothetical protein